MKLFLNVEIFPVIGQDILRQFVLLIPDQSSDGEPFKNLKLNDGLFYDVDDKKNGSLNH